MLKTNHNCLLSKQKIIQMSMDNLKKTLYKPSFTSPVMSLSAIFGLNHDLCHTLASEAFDRLFQANLCSNKDWSDAYIQLATYGVALSGFYYSYDTTTGKVSLYTSSFSELMYLYKNGTLKPKSGVLEIEMKKYKDTLVDSQRIATSIKKGDLIQAVRLDTEFYRNKPIFVPTVPRSQLNLTTEIIVPYESIGVAYKTILTELSTRILEVKMGDKVRYVTTNKEALSMIYGEERATALLNSILVQPLTQTFYVPSVGASIYTPGITNIDLFNVDSFRIVRSISEIDLSEINVSYALAKPYFLRYLKKADRKSYNEICTKLGILSDNETEKLDLLNTWVEKTFDGKVYEFMKQNQEYFPISKDYALQVQPLGDSYNTIPVPHTVLDLSNLLNTGVFKITTIKRTGKLSEHIVSNSDSHLIKILGINYYATYESFGNRIRRVLYECKGMENLTNNAFMEILGKYNLHSYALNCFNSQKETESLLTAVNRFFNLELETIELNKTVVKQNDLVLARNCKANISENEGRDYYKQIDLQNILSIVALTKQPGGTK